MVFSSTSPRVSSPDFRTPSAPSQPAVAVAEGLSFSYRFRKVFHGLDLHVPKGSVYGLIGPNGCGKSTLFQLLLGRFAASSGGLSLLGSNPTTEYVELRRRIGFVAQGNDLPPSLEIEETFDLFREVYGDRWNPWVAERLVGRLGISRHDQTPIRAMSGGQKQRLALVAALAVQPDLLLLDEPTSGLDAVVRRQFTESVIEFMAEDPNRTAIVSSHLLSEIEPLIDHVGILAPTPDGTRMLVECNLSDLKERTRVAELRGNPMPAELAAHPALLSAADDPDGTLVFWLDSETDETELTDAVEKAGGSLIERTRLDDVFVSLFRGHRVSYHGAVRLGRLVGRRMNSNP